MEKSASEDEICDLSLKPSTTSSENVEKSNDQPRPEPKNIEKSFDEALAHYDLDDFEPKQQISHAGNSESEDTDDEIEKVRQRQLQNNQNVEEKEQKDEYDQKTEGENEEDSNDKTQPMAEYFIGKTFFLCNDLAAVDIIKLERFIKDYRGEFAEDIEHANYAISRTGTNVPENFKGEVVRPLWVFECCDMECLIPTARYKV